MRIDFLKQYKTFLFDLDGTLIDSKPGIFSSLVYTLNQFGIDERDTEKLNSYIGPPVQVSLATNYGFSEEKALRAVDVYRARYAEKGMFECTIYPGVHETLSALKEKGVCLCLATSKLTRFAVDMVYNLGFDRYFSFIQGGDSATQSGGGWGGGISPACGKGFDLEIIDGTVIDKAETVRLCLNYAYAMGATPATTLMVGDRKYDAEGAIKNGLDCAGLLWGYGSREELVTAGAKYIIPDISALIKK